MTVPPGLSVSLIAAVDRHGLIGDSRQPGGLPWRLPDDLRRFRRLTWNKPVIFGRRTMQHVGRALPGRDCVVLTRDASFAMAGVRRAAEPAAALAMATECLAARGVANGEAMVGGGAEVYALFLPVATTVYLTRVEGEFAGDAWFPDFASLAQWPAETVETFPPGPDDSCGGCFQVLRRPAT